MSESKPKFQKLTPIRDADIGIYNDALNYVLKTKISEMSLYLAHIALAKAAF